MERCKWGHTDIAIYNGRYRCRVCNREGVRRFRERQKARQPEGFADKALRPEDIAVEDK